MRYFFIIILAFSGFQPAFGQSVVYIDSLKSAMLSAKDNQVKTRLAIELSAAMARNYPLEALEVAEQSVKLAVGLENDSLLAAAYNGQAKAYLQLSNYARSLEIFQKVLQTSSDSNIATSAYGNIGNIYYYKNDKDNALNYYLKSYQNFPKNVKYNNRISKVMNNIGVIYEEKKDFDKAVQYYDEALMLSRKFNDKENEANILNNFGTLYADLGDNEKALKNYEDAMELRRSEQDSLGIALSYNNIGNFYMARMKNYEKAETYLKQSVAISREKKHLRTLHSATNLLSELYEKTGRYKESLEALKEKMTTSDSLFNEENTRKIAQLEMQFEFDRRQKEQEVSQQEKEFYVLLGVSALVVLLALVSVLFLLQKNKTRKAQVKEALLHLDKVHLKNDLATRDKELATNIMFLLNKNELINTISEKLLDIKKDVPTEWQSPIQRVILDLQSNIQPDLWKEFEMRFQQVHETFYRSLNELFPDLTPNERRLCAFLKLNMSTKEISALTYQNAKSIDVARTRLRKKLNLTGTDQNLVTFLEQLDKGEGKG